MHRASSKKNRELQKDVTSLTPDDLKAFPVWEFTNEESEEGGDTVVRPIHKTPVASLDGRLAGTEVTLANGSKVWALLGNVSVKSPRSTQHFLSLSVLQDGRIFHLARYHDLDTDTHGPEALARFLGLEPPDVFPITYDLRGVCKARSASLVGLIEQEPRERLSGPERMALVFE